MNYFIYFIIIFSVLSIFLNLFIIIFDNKIIELENKIIKLFEKRTNLLPSLYDITKIYITKHDEVFNEILNLRKVEFSNYMEKFDIRLKNEIQIHHELNFIFKVISKNPKILNEWKYLLIKDLFLENSEEIWNQIKLYKIIINKLNFWINFKKYTIIWLFIDIKNRNDI